MYVGTYYLWGCIISAVAVLIGYTIWNVIAVIKNFAELAREAQQRMDT